MSKYPYGEYRVVIIQNKIKQKLWAMWTIWKGNAGIVLYTINPAIYEDDDIFDKPNMRKFK